MTQEEVVASLKRLLSERVRIPVARAQALEWDAPLLKDGLGLDSLDCVELTLGMEEAFGLVFDDSEEDWMHHFSCLGTLSQLVLLAKGELASPTAGTKVPQLVADLHQPREPGLDAQP